MSQLPAAWQETVDRAARDAEAAKARRIGSTDIACIAGFYNPALVPDLPKTKTITDVWLRLMWGFESTRNARMDRGLRLEPFGLEYYRQHVGPWWRALPLGEWWTVADPRNPDFTASPDAYDSPRHQIVVELKTQSEWARPQWGTPGTDEMATRYLYQAQWLCARCDAEQAHVLCIFGNDTKDEQGRDDFIVTEPAIYPVDRDDEVVAHLEAYAERFLSEFVQPGIPPPVKPAHNRRNMKARLRDERGADAADEWKQRCEQHAATNGLDELGRPLGAEGVADEAGAGDGVSGEGAEDRP